MSPSTHPHPTLASPATPASPRQLPGFLNTQTRSACSTQTVFPTTPQGAPPPTGLTWSGSGKRRSALQGRRKGLPKSLQQRCQGALIGRHVGHPEARTGRADNSVTAETDSGGSALVRPRPGALAAGSQPHRVHTGASGAQTQRPNLPLSAATRTQSHAALRSRPAPATTFPGSFQQGEEIQRGGGRSPGTRRLAARGGD